MPVKIFFCYTREDEPLLNKLKLHLEALRKQRLIELWYDRNISAGGEWEKEINNHLDTAHIILLLISQHFMASDYCYGIEMKKAMKRHELGEAVVIPIILRPVHFQEAPFSKLQSLPTDAKPVKSKSWHNQDEAFFDIAEGIRKAVEGIILKIKPEEFALLHTIHVPIIKEFIIGFSPDGQLLATVSHDGKIRLWQAHTGQLLHTIDEGNERKGFVISIIPAFSPDGQLLATASYDYDGKIRLWQVPTGQLLRTIKANFFCFSPDGQLLATVSHDGKIRLWQAHTGQLLHTIKANFFCFSPDGQLLATNLRDGEISIWMKK